MFIALDGNTHSDSVKPPIKPHMDQSANIARSKTGGPLVRRHPAAGGLAEIKHPLSAIVANANAARRWLSRPEPNFDEAIAALDRIVKESVRIDEAIADIRAVGERPDTSLP